MLETSFDFNKVSNDFKYISTICANCVDSLEKALFCIEPNQTTENILRMLIKSSSHNKDLNGTRERVKHALKHEDDPVPHKWRRRTENGDESREEISQNVSGTVASLNCRIIRIGSYINKLNNENVYISPRGITIVVPSLKYTE
ncbi:uncharacterized protein LOC123702303 [Colias croceus]|uniref:uncharacterized protein LOC123702303 n=1 Tax=Colias crocea TaxID=72248 RepID=UPI001E27CD1C|nr:uncharacterized protein LOC123702303 [Colias croceus]